MLMLIKCVVRSTVYQVVSFPAVSAVRPLLRLTTSHKVVRFLASMSSAEAPPSLACTTVHSVSEGASLGAEAAHVDQAANECTAEVAKATAECSEGATLSKNQRKRLVKAQKWEEGAAKRKEKRREKRQERRAKHKKEFDEGTREPRIFQEDTVQVDVNVVLDLSYEDKMTPHDVKKVRQQLHTSYAANRRNLRQVRLHFTSYGGSIKEQCERYSPGICNWKCNLTEQPYYSVFPKEQIVYLAPESPNVLTSLEEGKAYIVGGIVDHNSQKGLSYQLAEEKGIYHARLPIGDHLHLKTRHVLSIVHVVEILCEYVNKPDWLAAMLKVIPQRKGLTLLSSVAGAKQDNDNADDENAVPEVSCEAQAEDRVDAEKQTTE
eukprot:scpid69514/ scgid33934/ RNA (guanine-9-)-methyltransferase domain-containing protein 2